MKKTITQTIDVEPKVGNIVKVINPGSIYSTNEEFFMKYKTSIPDSYIIRYAFGKQIPSSIAKADFEVLYTASMYGKTLALITPVVEYHGNVYLIKSEALEFVSDRKESGYMPIDKYIFDF